MNLQFLNPEFCLFITAIALLVFGVFPSLNRLLGLFAAFGVVCAVLLLPGAIHSPTEAFYNLLQADRISAMFRILILLSTGLIVFISIGDKQIQKEDSGEYYFFILCLAISMMLAVSSKNLMMIYIAVEAVSIISYILVGYFKKNGFSSEAGLKYFLFGALSTGIMLYGISLLYGLFATLNLDAITTAVQTGHVNLPAFLLAIIFILVGLSFKCSLVPFHMAAPDAYQGAPTAVSAFLSIGPKAMGFALLIRVFLNGDVSIISQWGSLTQGLAIATMTVGNIIALKQTNVKRMLAYSSIAHAGFMLIALTMASTLGFKAILIYLFIYVFMNVGAFGCVILTEREEVEQYAGLSRQHPLVALIMATSLLSLAGLPPLAGFMAKFVVLVAAVQAKLYLLAIVAVLNSVVALFYYLRIIKVMYLSKNDFDKPINDSLELTLVLILTLLANIVLGLWPNGILQLFSLS